MSEFMERIGALIKRRRKVGKMIKSAHMAGANFIGVPRSIPDGSTVECIGVMHLTLSHGQDGSYHYYHTFSPDLARTLEVIMRKHFVVIMQ